jgi:hypothetical protein
VENVDPDRNNCILMSPNLMDTVVVIVAFEMEHHVQYFTIN